jgi:hypothetical protein
MCSLGDRFVEDLWHCPVLFTDSSAIGRALKQLNTTLMEKGNQQQHLSRRLQDIRAAQLVCGTMILCNKCEEKPFLINTHNITIHSFFGVLKLKTLHVG